MPFKYGRRPSDPAKLARRLRLVDYLPMTLVLPSSVDHSAVGEALGELGNDTVGDCTCAAAGHAIQVADWYGLSEVSTVNTQNILAVYSAITGYNPDDPNSDQGANLLDVLSYWRKTGIVGEKLDAYVAFDPTKVTHWQAVVDLYGVAYIGVWLPATVVNALDSGTVIDWTATTDPVTQDAGHCVAVVGYNASGLVVVTWGQTVTMSYAFAAKYCDEAYAPLMPSWASGKEPNALDVAQLTADLAIVTGGGVIPVDPPTPTPTPTPTPPVPPESEIAKALEAVEKALVKAANEIAKIVKGLT
jgi:hypothetical protein